MWQLYVKRLSQLTTILVIFITVQTQDDKKLSRPKLQTKLFLCDLGQLTENMSIPKVSTVHQGFAGTFTHMDGNDGEEKERKRHL